MKLFHSPASPYVRKINVLLHELGQTDAVDLLPTATTALDSDQALMAKNPLAKLPALERDDGVTLYDSRVITAFLNDRFNGTFYPQGARKWETLVLEATGDGMLDCAVPMIYEIRLRPENERSPRYVEALWAKVDRALTALNDRWMSHLAGPVDMGQIAVACALGYLDFRHDARNWRDGNDTLAAWFETFSARPSMQATLPQG